MTCDEVLDLLLEADSEVLRGEGTSPVAMHLATCARCRRVAAALTEAEHSARSAWQSAASTRSVEAVLRGVREAEAAPVPDPVARPSGWRMVRRAGLSLVGLATAAGLVLAVMNRYTGGRRGAPPRAASAFVLPPDSPPTIAVDVPPGRNAIVFATRDPSISVVWIY